MRSATRRTNLLLVGGGLANSLLAYRLRQLRPEIRLLVVERGRELGGNHTWSFHGTDLNPEESAWTAPLVEYSWPHYEVRFPGLRRRIAGGYRSITSARLHQVVSEALGPDLMLDAPVERISSGEVLLADGTRIEADAVIDGRGYLPSPHLVLAYQKFLGQVVRLRHAHGLEGPILMDATVEQRDGYRFVYTLPFSSRLALIEDTRYSDRPALARGEMREAIHGYAERMGWHVDAVEREEEGILPIVLCGDIEAFWRSAEPGMARSGLRAALFHPTTGYSLPHAVRLSDYLSRLTRLDLASLTREIQRRSIATWRENAFFRVLNRMMFVAGEPAQRFRILERFYRLPESLIARFYAGHLTLVDRLRLVTGSPPVPVGRAVRCLLESSVRGRLPSQPEAGSDPGSPT